MDQPFVSVLTRALSRAPSRRDIMRGLANAGLGLAGLRLADSAAAKKKRKKKKKKPQPAPSAQPPPLPPPLPPPTLNAFGCVDVGQACRGNSALCCSGLCQGAPPEPGQPDTSVCVAHNAGICTAQHDSCVAGLSVSCHSSNEWCFCTMTTGNAPFCGDFSGGGGGPQALCQVCRKDTDCQAELGAGAACVLLDEFCTATCLATLRTACVPPCA